MGCALAAVLLAACSPPPPAPKSAPGRTPPTPHTASLAAAGRPRATLAVVTGTTPLTIGRADFGADRPLLRATTPAGDPPPRLRRTEADGTAPAGEDPLVTLSAKKTSALTVTLNAAVSWQLDLAGGISRTVADLRGGQVTGISLTAGADVIDLILPRPRGRGPVQLGPGPASSCLACRAGSGPG